MSFSFIYITIITILLTISGYYDLRTRTIPNILPISITLIGLVGLIFFNTGITPLVILLDFVFILMVILLYKAKAFMTGDALILLSVIIAFPFSTIVPIIFIVSILIAYLMLLLKVHPVPYVACYALAFIGLVVGEMIL